MELGNLSRRHFMSILVAGSMLALAGCNARSTNDETSEHRVPKGHI